MFHLEHSLTAWREQMLAAGIGSPVPLEELEAHLREEIDRQLQAGLSEPEAFHAAVQNLGPAVPLKTEFTKTAGLRAWFGHDSFTRTNRILGTLWIFNAGLISIWTAFLTVVNFKQHPYIGMLWILVNLQTGFRLIKSFLGVTRGDNQARIEMRRMAKIWLSFGCVFGIILGLPLSLLLPHTPKDLIWIGTFSAYNLALASVTLRLLPANGERWKFSTVQRWPFFAIRLLPGNEPAAPKRAN